MALGGVVTFWFGTLACNYEPFDWYSNTERSPKRMCHPRNGFGEPRAYRRLFLYRCTECRTRARRIRQIRARVISNTRTGRGFVRDFKYTVTEFPPRVGEKHWWRDTLNSIRTRARETKKNILRSPARFKTVIYGVRNRSPRLDADVSFINFENRCQHIYA